MHVGDREADIYELFCAANDVGTHFVIRSAYPTARDTPALSAYDHFTTMVFAQLTYREGLCDIEACLNARRPLLYHAGIRGAVKRCNLAYANEHRDWQLFAAVAGDGRIAASGAPALCRRADATRFGCRSVRLGCDADRFEPRLVSRARWQGTQAAVKLTVLLNLRADILAFASLHEGDRHEVASLDEIPVYL